MEETPANTVYRRRETAPNNGKGPKLDALPLRESQQRQLSSISVPSLATGEAGSSIYNMESGIYLSRIAVSLY